MNLKLGVLTIVLGAIAGAQPPAAARCGGSGARPLWGSVGLDRNRGGVSDRVRWWRSIFSRHGMDHDGACDGRGNAAARRNRG